LKFLPVSRPDEERKPPTAVGEHMLSNLKRQWRALRKSRPGHRFEDRYDRIKKSAAQNKIGARLVRFVIALISLVVGVVFTLFPGPSFIFYVISAALLASESLRLARWLDAGEVWGRKAWNWARRSFRKLPLAGKIAVGFVGALMAGAGVWLTYATFMS
jgi:uncharacterized membrane protein YbaN (DUF454 family)